MSRLALPQFTDRVCLGEGPRVSPFCLGMTSSPKVVEAAFEAGINFFFLSSDLRWPKYEPMRAGLRRLFRKPGVRDQVVVCVASYVASSAFSRGAALETLEAVTGLERIDMLVAGGLNGHDFERRLAEYSKWRVEKQAMAGSFHDRRAAREVVEQRRVDAAFIRFNPLHPRARVEVLPFASADGPPVFAFKTSNGAVSPEVLKLAGLDDDNWFPSVGDHYRYALSEERLTGILFSPTRLDHLRQASDALAQGPLSAEECVYLEALSQRVLATRLRPGSL